MILDFGIQCVTHFLQRCLELIIHFQSKAENSFPNNSCLHQSSHYVFRVHVSLLMLTSHWTPDSATLYTAADWSV